jgi:hypothetical protein
MAYFEYLPRGTLLQYTSADGLRGIIQSKELRFSDLREANDPRELDLGYEKVIGALRIILQAEPAGPKADHLSHLIDRLDAYFRNVQVFCSCFSLAVDELPMWAAYGQNYSGVALGFRPTAITAMPARVQKVRYIKPASENEESRLIAQGIADQVDLYLRTNDLAPWIAAGTAAITAATASKGEKWSYEREVRIVYVQRKVRPEGDAANMPIGVIGKNDLVYWREPSHRPVGNRQISYVSFPFGKYRDGKWKHSRAIKSVTVGPNCPMSTAEVERLLTDNGFEDFVVEKSGCQIRV